MLWVVPAWPVELVLQWFVMSRGSEEGERVRLVAVRAGEEVGADEVLEVEVEAQSREGADVHVLESWEDSDVEQWG